MSEMLEILKEKSPLAHRAWQIIFSGGATPVQVAAFLCQTKLNSVIAALEILGQKKKPIKQAILISDLSHRRTKRRNLELPLAAIFSSLGHQIVLNDRSSNIPENAIAKHNSSADLLFEMGLKPHLESHYGLENDIIFSEIFHSQPKLKLIFEIEQQIGFRGFFKLLKTFLQPINASCHLIIADSHEQMSLIQEMLHFMKAENAVIISENSDNYKFTHFKNKDIVTHHEVPKEFIQDESFLPEKTIENNGQKLVNLLKNQEESQFVICLKQIAIKANMLLFDKNCQESSNEIEKTMKKQPISKIRLFIEKANLCSMEKKILYKNKKSLYKATLDKIKQKIDEGS